jgi:hypothetical protein
MTLNELNHKYFVRRAKYESAGKGRVRMEASWTELRAGMDYMDYLRELRANFPSEYGVHCCYMALQDYENRERTKSNYRHRIKSLSELYGLNKETVSRFYAAV